MKALKDGVIEYKLRIADIDNEKKELEKRFKDEKKKRDDITDKESEQFELQDKITEEISEELQKKTEKRNYLEKRVNNTIKVVRIILNRDRQEIEKRILELEEKKENFEKQKGEFEELINRDDANPIVKEDDKIQQNRRKLRNYQKKYQL